MPAVRPATGAKEEYKGRRTKKGEIDKRKYFGNIIGAEAKDRGEGFHKKSR